MDSQQNQGIADVFRAVVTFERDKGDPVVVRLTLVDSEPEVAVRKAVFRALPEAPRKWDSVVVVLDRLPAPAAPVDAVDPVGGRVTA